jgi:hypothetical protein
MRTRPASVVSTRLAPFFLLICAVLTCPSLFAADIKPEDVIAKSLESIAPAPVRAAVKSRVTQGPATYRVLTGGSGAVDGKFVLASEGPKSDFLFKVMTNGFLGEQFICDGNKISVAGTYTDKQRSEFGTFVLSQEILLRENLLGGALSSGWALLDIDSHKPKLHYEGIKKMDNRDLIALRYQSKKSGDMEIFFYFDPQTYQHVMSTFQVRISSGIGLGGETTSARQQENRSLIQERFSDFKAIDGLTLPTHYDLRFTLETPGGFTKSIEWEAKSLTILNNQSVDPRSFQVK